MADTPPRVASTDSVADEAAFWCMRVHDESCTEEDRRAFDRWLRSDPVHAAEYQAMLEIWTVSGSLDRRDGLLATDAPARTRSAWRRLPLPVAASLLLAAFIGWTFGLVPHSYQRYRADQQLRSVTLADGSRVQLNLNTSLSFLNFRDRRQAILDEGEAFFEVRHDAAKSPTGDDAAHPFVVKAGDGRIVVTGTAFNVWKYGDQVVVTLQEGSIRIIGGRGNHTVKLAPGHQARYGDGNAFPTVTVANAAEALAWREGKIVINDLSLAEALPLINRYLERPVLLADRATGQLRVGGIFNTNDMLGLVMRLPKVLPVHLAQNETGNIVIRRRGDASG